MTLKKYLEIIDKAVARLLKYETNKTTGKKRISKTNTRRSKGKKGSPKAKK